MALIYTLKVTALQKRISDGAILKVSWTKTATNQDNVSVEFNAWTDFASVTAIDNEFIQFSQLTEETILNWIKASPVYEDCNSVLEQRIIQAANPVEVLGDNQFPWTPVASPIVYGDTSDIGSG